MKKALIKCLSKRRPSVDGLRLELGQEIEVSVDDAELLSKLGFAEILNVSAGKDSRGVGKDNSKPKPRRKRNAKGQSTSS